MTKIYVLQRMYKHTETVTDIRGAFDGPYSGKGIHAVELLEYKIAFKLLYVGESL